MVDILNAVLTDGLPAVEAACAEAIAHGVHSADVVLNILARQRDPAPPANILTPAALTLRHAPIADCDLCVEICRQLYVGDLKPAKQGDIETAMLQWLDTRFEWITFGVHIDSTVNEYASDGLANGPASRPATHGCSFRSMGAARS